MKKPILPLLKALVFLMMLFFSITIQAQGKFVIRGQVQKADKIARRDVPLANATVALYKGDKKITFIKTEKNGTFDFKDLEYGHIYKVTFKAVNCIEMFLVLDANIPENKREYDLGVQSNFILYDDEDKEIDAKKYKYPFMKVAFNGKDLAPDKQYTEDFNKGIIPEMKADEEKALAGQKALAEKQAKENLEAEKKKKEEEELAKKYVKIAGKLLTGEKPAKPIANTNIKLVNAKGEVVQIVKTNIMGSFVFNKVLPGQDYIIRMDESTEQVAPNVKVSFTEKNDKEVMTTFADAKGRFELKMLTNDTQTLSLIAVNDADVKIDLKGKMLGWNDGAKKPLAEVRINLVSKSEIVQSTKTDKEGTFVFTYLTSNLNYTLSVDETDPQVANQKKLLLTDETGNVIKEVQPDQNKKFNFELLPYEVNKMSKMYVDDPWLTLIDPKMIKTGGLVITERVYFNVNDDKLLPDAEKTLDKVISILNNAPGISVELSSHTDSQGADDYNLKLSEKRAQSAVKYMTTHGMSAAKVTGKGYGETQLLNKCGNAVKCTEEEHAKNRRLEFKVLKK
ncbi:MAG: OmpA family protein [Bacteroidota bacterium]